MKMNTLANASILVYKVLASKYWRRRFGSDVIALTFCRLDVLVPALVRRDCSASFYLVGALKQRRKLLKTGSLSRRNFEHKICKLFYLPLPRYKHHFYRSGNYLPQITLSWEDPELYAWFWTADICFFSLNLSMYHTVQRLTSRCITLRRRENDVLVTSSRSEKLIHICFSRSFPVLTR